MGGGISRGGRSKSKVVLIGRERNIGTSQKADQKLIFFHRQEGSRPTLTLTSKGSSSNGLMGPNLSNSSVASSTNRQSYVQGMVYSEYGDYEGIIDSYLDPVLSRETYISKSFARIVQDSWTQIALGKTRQFQENAADMGFCDPVAFFAYSFYGKLFSRIPRTQYILKKDPHQRYGKLAKIIELLQVLPCQTEQENKNTFKVIRRSHQKYRVNASWYSQFGTTLLRTVSLHLKREMTHDISQAWTAMIAFTIRGLVYQYIRGIENEVACDASQNGSGGPITSK